MSNTDHHPERKPCADEQQTIGSFLAAALNMEDQISHGVYEEYLKRDKWPPQLDRDTFLQIQDRLRILIEDTKKHHKILQALVDQHGQRE